MTRLVVVDTNVPIVANGDSHVSPDCMLRCVEALVEITGGEAAIVIDDDGLIVDEYAQNLSAGAPGVGSAFLLWLYNNQWDEACCQRVELTVDPDSADGDFVEFPRRPELESFDRSDRKFVAVAAGHPDHPPILQAADAKWIGWAAALEAAGVSVKFLCEDELREQYQAKFGADSTGGAEDA